MSAPTVLSDELEYSRDEQRWIIAACGDDSYVYGLVLNDALYTRAMLARAAATLVEQLGGKVVEYAFIVELAFLNPRNRLAPNEVFSLVQYDAE